MEFFNTTRLAVPAPGHLQPHAYCSDCGHQLDTKDAMKPLYAALNEPAGTRHTRESYMDWLLAPLSNSTTSAPA